MAATIITITSLINNCLHPRIIFLKAIIKIIQNYYYYYLIIIAISIILLTIIFISITIDIVAIN
jgi:hypothetical protein